MNENNNSASQPLFATLPSHFEDYDNDWTYAMRREMQEIVPGVFLGPYAVASKKMLPYLQEHHITHVVCVRHPAEARMIKPNFPEELQYLIIDLVDENPAFIIPLFSKVREFIDHCLQLGGKVLIHGNTGISASAAIAIAFVMEKYGTTSEEAFQIVQRRRFCINPNEELKRQLLDYEALYLARRQTPQIQTAEGLKRSRDDIVEGTFMEHPYKKSSR